MKIYLFSTQNKFQLHMTDIITFQVHERSGISYPNQTKHPKKIFYIHTEKWQ